MSLDDIRRTMREGEGWTVWAFDHQRGVLQLVRSDGRTLEIGAADVIRLLAGETR